MTTSIGTTTGPNPGLAMTLAAIAYCADPATTLNNLDNGWTAVWAAISPPFLHHGCCINLRRTMPVYRRSSPS
ncbi:hypothetical protein ACO0LC_15645 [Undibacterium sp. JH2W]|uniref:hypothetical protein n=1 Tax=Undibacterium sp. JH2W TaxID=3413037 RepID=UPI003BF06AE1